MKVEKSESQKSDEVLEEWTNLDGVFRKIRVTRYKIGGNGSSAVFEMIQRQIDHTEEGGPIGWETINKEELPSV